jgi:hypothetical protein
MWKASTECEAIAVWFDCSNICGDEVRTLWFVSSEPSLCEASQQYIALLP